MVLQTRRVEQGLRKKGFKSDDTLHNRDHNVFRYVTSDGLVTDIWTKTSRGRSGSKKDISGDLLDWMADQCGLKRREFVDLVNCPMTRDEYEKTLAERGFFE